LSPQLGRGRGKARNLNHPDGWGTESTTISHGLLIKARSEASPKKKERTGSQYKGSKKVIGGLL